MPAPASDSARLPALDGLRGLACLLVFGVHFGQITKVGGQAGPFDLHRFLANGNTGVAIFFTLSGFLLSMPFWAACRREAPPPAILPYLERRAARILPAYYACLTAVAVANRLWEESGGWTNLALHYALLFNLSERSVFGVNPPFWTIAVEIQFYILLPWLFLSTRSLGVRGGVAGLAVAGAAGYACYAWLGSIATGATAGAALQAPAGEVSPVLTYSLLAHLPHFLLGAVAGAGAARAAAAARAAPRAGDAVAIGSLAFVLLVIATPLDEILQVPWGRYNLPFVPVAIALLVSTAPHSAAARAIFDHWSWGGLGRISYGVYLYHLPVQHVTARAMARMSMSAERDWLVFGLASFVLTVVVATLSHRLLEEPVLRAVRRRGRTGAASASPGPARSRRPSA
jgi:peptidoglycan/LPS O-acetylase OafA/YrhL